MSPDTPRLRELLHARREIDLAIDAERRLMRRIAGVRQLVVTALDYDPSHGDMLIEAVAHSFDIQPDDITGTSRVARHFEARAICAYILRAAGWKLTAIGKKLNRDHTSVLAAIGRVETTDRLREIAEQIAENGTLPRELRIVG
jgi:chromosomal replication initiation ATPase DnaA